MAPMCDLQQVGDLQRKPRPHSASRIERAPFGGGMEVKAGRKRKHFPRSTLVMFLAKLAEFHYPALSSKHVDAAPRLPAASHCAS